MQNMINRLKIRKKLNRYDKFNYSFYKKVQKGFLKLASKNKHKYKIIDSNLDIKNNHIQVIKQIEKLVNVLKVMGYEPKHDEKKKNVNFTSHGFKNFKRNEKNIVRAILGDKLREFFYGHSTQYIYYF